LEIGGRSLEQFAQPGLEPQSSQSVSQVVRITGMSHQHLDNLIYLIPKTYTFFGNGHYLNT
jgi:hypothetical protein